MQLVRRSLATGSGCNISGLLCSLKILPCQRLRLLLSPLCGLQMIAKQSVNSRPLTMRRKVLTYSLRYNAEPGQDLFTSVF